MTAVLPPKGTKVPGHSLSMEWSGEYGAESSSTGTCKCGNWTESASTQFEVRREYRWHLASVLSTHSTADRS
jgi:hypothetical protein